MAMELGCLLGEYGGYMSFEPFSSNVGSFWTAGAKLPFTLPQVLSDPGTASSLSTATHSSNVGLILNVTSSAGDVIFTYDHADDNDMFARWSPDVTTHRLNLKFWGNQSSGTQEKYLRGYIGTSDTLADISSYSEIRSSDNLELYQIDTVNVTSDAIIQTVFYQVQSGGVDPGSVAIILDDIFATVDTVELCPNFNASVDRPLNLKSEETLTGRYIDFSYGTREAFTLDFSHVGEVEAKIINRWWFNQYNLMFMFDTSDSTTIHTVRITNKEKPFGQVTRPYYNKYSGQLKLEAINNGGWY